jgi:hypothetical protein
MTRENKNEIGQACSLESSCVQIIIQLKHIGRQKLGRWNPTFLCVLHVLNTVIQVHSNLLGLANYCPPSMVHI